MPDYVRELCAAVGHRRLIMVGAAGVVQDEAVRPPFFLPWTTCQPTCMRGIAAA